MQPIDNYLSLVMRMTAVSFCKEENGVFLLKRPNALLSERSIPVQISFDTVHEAIEFDPFAKEWMIAAVRKRAGNPYADRISIGRATNCDIVLRVPFVSKVQAHILQSAAGGHALRSCGSAVGTLLNGRKVAPNSSVPLAIGDSISFGALTFEFVDAGRLYEVLASEALRRNSNKSQRPSPA